MGQNTGILKETKNMDTGQSIKNKIVHATHEAQLSKPKEIQTRALLTGIIPYPLKTILRPKVGTMDHKIQISGLTYLGSYSWVESHVPTIIVPGE